MESGEVGVGGAWVRDACTRPTAQRPLRVAAFDELFAEVVRGIERAGPAAARSSGRPAGRPRAAELAAAGCCWFFTFTLTATGGGLVVEVTVPEFRTWVLDALAGRVAAAAGIAA